LEDAQKEQYAFEDSVRATARMLWNEAALDGAGKLDARERDGIFETRDTIHIVEATVSQKLIKVQDDGRKTHDAVIKLRREGEKFAQGWIITKNEPTADQRDWIKKKYSATTQILSFDQFRSRLFNGQEYLNYRSKHRFGSILDFSNGTVHVAEEEFVPVDFIGFDRANAIPYISVFGNSPNGTRRRYLILGEYGSGKSMSLRGGFIYRRKSYLAGQTVKCPIYLNLREHTGQSLPVEALERHARLIGYPGPANDLVRAWRAGFVDLFLDGFDEMATAGWGGALSKVRNHRFAGMALVRGFLSESPEQADIFIAGRENFFDTPTEMRGALGIGKHFEVVRTAEFGSDELAAFLRKKNFRGKFPAWLPARPLLISYLLAEDVLQVLDGEDQQLDEATGWEHLLDMVSAREASQDSRLDPQLVRRLIERLATLARTTVDGLGRLDVATIQSAFQSEAGFAPDEGSAQLLLRLPGLAPSSKEDGTRRFVDVSLVSAAKAGDVFRFIEHPYDSSIDLFNGTISGIGSLGRAVLLHKLIAYNISSAQVVRALEIAANSDEATQICAELLSSYTELGEECNIGPMVLRSISDDEIVFSVGDASLRKITFQQCLFGAVHVEPDFQISDLPIFKDCVIGSLTGIISRSPLPSQLASSEISEIPDEVSTNAQLFSAALPESQKVLISILRKLFLQPGAGRQESAFFRGAMDERSKSLVPEILDKVASYGFAQRNKLKGKNIWHPNRAMSSEARKIIFNPAQKEHPLVKAILSS